ncbi:MAG: peptidylprolyl isomerase [Flavobacteriales bacterium]|nr:peptidylprolyl isomerase [Flavobacteriales bacterium]
MSITFAHAQDEGVVVNQIIATVGNDIILQSELEEQYKQLLAQGIDPPGNIRCQILEDILFQKLLKNQAKIDSVTVSASQVESELDRRVSYFVRQIGSVEKMEEYYEKSIIEIKDEFRELIEEQLLSQTMRGKIINDIKVSPSEVRQFYKEIPEDSLPYINMEVELSHLVLYPEINDDQKREVKDKLTSYRDRVVEGTTSFAALARIYSEDPSYKQGGELGFVQRGDLVPEFEAVAFQLTPIDEVNRMVDSASAELTKLKKLGGEDLEARLNRMNKSIDSLKRMRCSHIVESQFGFHLIQLIERRGEQINVRHILLRPKLSEDDIQKSQVKLDSIRTVIRNGGMTFEEAVLKFSNDEDSKQSGGKIVNPNTGTTRFEMDQLDPLLSFTVNPMDVGNISEPITSQSMDGKSGYRIVKLSSRTSPHQMNLKDDYKRVQDMAQAQKETNAISDWIQKKRNNMYIHISDAFKSCVFMNNWVN